MENPHPDDQERSLLQEGIIGGEELAGPPGQQGLGCLLSSIGLWLATPFAGCLLLLVVPLLLIPVAIVALLGSLDIVVLVPLILLIAAGVLLIWPKKKRHRRADGTFTRSD